MTLLLTEAERERFASYLEMDAAQSEGLLKQMEQIPNMELIIRKTKIEIAAQKLVAKMLRSTHGEAI